MPELQVADGEYCEMWTTGSSGISPAHETTFLNITSLQSLKQQSHHNWQNACEGVRPVPCIFCSFPQLRGRFTINLLLNRRDRSRRCVQLMPPRQSPFQQRPAQSAESASLFNRTSQAKRHSKNRRMAFSVICETCSSTGRLLTHEIEPTENTPPQCGVSK